MRVDRQSDTQREVDGEDSPRDNHGGWHQTCREKESTRKENQIFVQKQQRRLRFFFFFSNASHSRTRTNSRLDSLTCQRDARRVVNLHHHRPAVSCGSSRKEEQMWWFPCQHISLKRLGEGMGESHSASIKGRDSTDLIFN